MEKGKIKKAVRDGYAAIARQEGSCCSSGNSCCGDPGSKDRTAAVMGYTDEELASLPKGANLGLGCGNPVALASLQEGDTVLDLGSGAGVDCFLAARKVGRTGRVIGVDMTPEMLEKARGNAEKSGYKNVEFRLGEIENLPVADASVDIVISNCVINLSFEKGKVFNEILRVLRPGGRFMISDIVLLKELPDSVKSSAKAYVGCLSGAVMKERYLNDIRSAGFQNVRIINENSYSAGLTADDSAVSILVYGEKAGTGAF